MPRKRYNRQFRAPECDGAQTGHTVIWYHHCSNPLVWAVRPTERMNIISCCINNIIYNGEHMYVYMATLKPVLEWQYKYCEATHRITGTVRCAYAVRRSMQWGMRAIRVHSRLTISSVRDKLRYLHDVASWMAVAGPRSRSPTIT